MGRQGAGPSLDRNRGGGLHGVGNLWCIPGGPEGTTEQKGPVMADVEEVEMKRSLTLTGVTVNAMALIAPGAFPWTTFQVQAAQTAGGKSTAGEMWTGLLFALVLAFLTAYSYSELARIYPDAG